MRSKRIIGIAVVVIIIITGGIILGLYIDDEIKDKKSEQELIKENINYNMDYENERTIDNEKERTNEEYMAILTDNQDDFEYVAQTMQQWSNGYIDFYDDYGRRIDFEDVSSNNPEIEDEISNNADFYNSLYNLYELDEIYYIVIEKEYGIMFYFSKFPRNYHGGVAYGGIEREWPATPIDDNWVLKMIPNT